MARAQDQRRWRTNTDRQRIEVYLPVDKLTALDELARARGVSRATVIDDLIAEAMPATAPVSTQAASTDAPADDAPWATDTAPSEAADTPQAPTETPPTTRASEKLGYRFHRPQRPEETRYQWIAVADDGTRIALTPDPVRFYRWSGFILDGSLYIRDAKSNNRDEIVRTLLQRR